MSAPPASAAATPAPVSAAATPTPVSAAATPAPVLHLIDGVHDARSVIDHRTVCRRSRTIRCIDHNDARSNKHCENDASHSSSPFLFPCHTRKRDESVLRWAASSSDSDPKLCRPEKKQEKERVVPQPRYVDFFDKSSRVRKSTQLCFISRLGWRTMQGVTARLRPRY